MGDMMPQDQAEFIDTISKYINETTNYGEERASQFAFEVWQNRKWLTKFLGNNDIDELVAMLKERNINAYNYPMNLVNECAERIKGQE